MFLQTKKYTWKYQPTTDRLRQQNAYRQQMRIDTQKNDESELRRRVERGERTDTLWSPA
jgi:hypothetical protein